MTTGTAAKRLGLIVLIACASARCGGGSTGPSGTPAAAHDIVVTVAPTLAEADVQVSWAAATGSSSSEIDITTTLGAPVIQTTVGNATSYHWQHVAYGNYYISIKSQAGSKTLTSSLLPLQLPPLKQLIDAMFLGQGPLAQVPSNLDTAQWFGAPRGASYELLVKSTVTLASVQSAVNQLQQAVNNQLSFTITTVSTLPASPGAHQILISDTLAICGGVPPEAVGVTCGLFVDAQGLTSGKIGLSNGVGEITGVVLHELCHAIPVLSHSLTSIAYFPLIMSPSTSLNNTFSPYEIAAISAVYANTSVAPFSTRVAFRAAGLVE